MAFQEGAQTLARLGLTISQAKVYLALLTTGKATAGTISKCAKMARQEVYRVLAELQEKGLVERIITVPTEFKPIPIEDCLSILIERKKRDISEIEKKATKLIQKLREKNSKNILQKEESQFILVSEKGKYLKKARKLIENAQTSIDVITTSKRFQFFISFLGEEVRKALKRGVKMRVIMEKAEDEKSLPEIAVDLMQNPLFMVKYMLNFPRTILWITDNKEVTIVTSAKTDLDESPTLWTNNQVIIEIIQNYFKILWFTGMESEPQVSHSLKT